LRIALYDDRHFSAFGAQRVMVSLATQLKSRGWEPTIITGAIGSLSALADEAGVAVHIVPIPRQLDIYSGEALRAPFRTKLRLARFALRYSREIHLAVKALRSDIVFANALRPLLYCAVSRIRTRRPVVWFLQGGRSFRLVSVVAVTLPYRIMMVSQGAAKALPRPLRPLLLPRAFVNSPGIDVSRFAGRSADREQTRQRWGLPREAFLVAGVGSIEHRKGFDVLLRALDLARDRVPNLHVVIAGSTRGALAQAYERELLALARRRALPVSLLGWVDDTAGLMAAADVFVLSSRQERFGLVTVEAMASGLPVIVTRADGSEETIIDGESGLLVEPEDPSALADRIVRLATDSTLRANLAAGGRRRAQEHYTLDRFVDRFIAEMERDQRMKRRPRSL